jgi:hypothetical protein
MAVDGLRYYLCFIELFLILYVYKLAKQMDGFYVSLLFSHMPQVSVIL